MKRDERFEAERVARSRRCAVHVAAAAITAASSLLLATLSPEAAAAHELPAPGRPPVDEATAARVVWLVLAASPETAASLRVSLGELARRLGVELREHGAGGAWAELEIELPAAGVATVVLRDGKTRRVRLERKLREVGSAQVLVETAAAIAHGGLETMLQEAPPAPAVVGPSRPSPPPPPRPSHNVPERSPFGGTSMALPVTSRPGPSDTMTDPALRAAESRVESGAPAVLVAALSAPALVPTPAGAPVARPADLGESTASLSASASPAEPPRSFPVRIAVESSGAFDTERSSWGVGLAASLSLPNAPLAPRLALGGARWQSLDALRPPDRWIAGLVAQAELAGAMLRTASLSWHLGPVVSWSRQTAASSPAYAEQRPVVGPPISGTLPEPGPGAVSTGGAPVDPVPRGPAPFAAAPPSGEVTRNVFDYGLSSRLALRLSHRAELFAGVAATTARRFSASDAARAAREGQPLGATRTWTLLTSVGVAVALTPL